MQRPPSFPPFQTLRAFVAVAELKSFTKAAELLCVTQTAVSHSVAQLESWLGARLFVRDRRGVELTSLGAKLAPELGRSIESLAEMLERARRLSARGQLRISTTPEFSTQWLSPRIPDFCGRHPDVDLSVVVEYRRTRFAVDDVDIAIWLGGVLQQPGAEILTSDEEFAVCAPAVAKTLPSRGALRAAQLLRYEGSRYTALDWRRWYGQVSGTDSEAVGIEFDDGPCYATFSEMLAACKQGAGIALVRTSLVADELLGGRLQRCFSETINSDLQYQLMVSDERRNDPEVLAFRSWLLGQAATLRSD